MCTENDTYRITCSYSLHQIILCKMHNASYKVVLFFSVILTFYFIGNEVYILKGGAKRATQNIQEIYTNCQKEQPISVIHTWYVIYITFTIHNIYIACIIKLFGHFLHWYLNFI